LENPLNNINKGSISDKDIDFGNRLIAKLYAGAITKDEFLRECTYFTLRCGFDELKPHQMPTKPIALRKFEELPEREKKKAREITFDEPEVRNYLAQKNAVIRRNSSNLKWLKENLSRLESYGDPHYSEMVRTRIQDFEEWNLENI
jgi:hypothetical protein